MLLFAADGTPVGQLLTSELIAQELVRSVVGTIGLTTAVPITTALAAFLAARHTSDAGETAHPSSHVAPGPRPVTDPWTAFVECHADDRT
jgi:hypothetical protein